MAKTIVKEPPVYVAKLEAALRTRLRGADVMHERIRGDRYRFIVVWNRFDRMGHPDRQDKVWDLADQTLSTPELRKIGMILTIGRKEAGSAVLEVAANNTGIDEP